MNRIVQLIIQMKERNRGVNAQLNSSHHSSVTQPVGQGRNAKRVQQIQALHLEFEDLKKKIKDVQNKNQKIIENIHKRYDFKKKPQTMECMVEERPIVYFDHPQDKSQLSAQNRSYDSNDSECEFKIGKPIVRKTSNIKRNLNSGNQSIEYRRTQQNMEEREGSDICSNKSGFNPPIKHMSSGPQYPMGTGSNFRAQMTPTEQFQVSQFTGIPPYQMSMQLPQYPSMTYTQSDNFYANNSYQLSQNIRRQRQKIKFLENQLQQKQNDSISLKRLQKRYNSLSLTYSQAIESSLQDFMEDVVKKRFNEIQKYVKKNENKLRKLHLMIKDKGEENRSAKNIQEHRKKRSTSRNKRQQSPINPNYYKSLPRGPRRNLMTQPQLMNQNDSSSASKSKVSDQSKSSIKFQQIATQYEDMIKTKNKELQSFQTRLKQKERELVEMSAKCAQLQLKLTETEEVPKSSKRVGSEREDLLLSNLQFQSEKDGQLKQLNRKIRQLQQLLNKTDGLLKEKEVKVEKLNKKVADSQIKVKKMDVQAKRLKEELAKKENSSKDDTEVQVKLKRLQNQLQSKQSEYSLTKQKCLKLQSEKIERQCENMTLENRIKKIEQLLAVRQQKISQLQKIIQSNAGNDIPDLLQRSVIVQKYEQAELQNIQAEKQKLEDEITKKDQQLYVLKKNHESLNSRFADCENAKDILKKQVEVLQIQNQSMKINLKAMEFQKYSVKNDSRSPLQKLLDENQCVSENDDNSAIREELEEMRDKYEQSQRQLKVQKHESLEFNTKLIKINSELSYYKDQLCDRQIKYEKLRRQFQQNKFEVNKFQLLLQEKENELEVEKKQNNEKIMELESQWLQFQEEMRNKDQNEGVNNMSDLRSSRNFSEESFIGYKNTFNNINAQNEHLNEKLKEAEKIIQIQKQMEMKIVEEYRSNVEIIKSELKQKVRTSDALKEELQTLKRKVKVLEKNENRLKELSQKGEKAVTGDTNSKIQVLQLELAEMQEIKSKQESMEQQLYKQLAEKDQDNENLMRKVGFQERKIEELEELIELKEMHFSSNISSSQNKSKIKDSLHSNSSLRYSMLSNNANNNRTIDFQLSEAGQSFYQHNQSMISNVSQVFNMAEFPYQKMHLKRVEQRRLFEKTAAYIKSLKNAIDEKSKKIKLLQKKIESLRNSQLIRKDIFDIKQNMDLQPDDNEIFKDYYSVQNHSSSFQRYKFKQLEHQTKLTIEENNLLINQIENLQDQIQKADQQENSLMKLKDLYKDEIKNLIKKNQEQAKTFEEEVKKERLKVEQSQSVRKMDALKQLYIKIMDVVVNMEHEGPKSKKREDHKKELEGYTKVFCNFLDVEEPIREKMLSEIRR